MNKNIKNSIDLKIFWSLKSNLLKKFNPDLTLIKKTNKIIKKEKPINIESKEKGDIYNISSAVLNSIPSDRLSKPKKICQFAALLLCGGSATRFNSNPKASFVIKDFPKFEKSTSFLMLNILQILKFENEHNIKIPVIIYLDFYTRESILTHLKENNFFGKNPKEFYFITQPSGLRYIPSLKLLELNNLTSGLSETIKKSLPKVSRILITDNLVDSFVGIGHFVFNSLISSDSFRLLLKNYPEVSSLVISNVDNLGQKYFAELLVSKNSKNYILVCKRKKNENIDSVLVKDSRVYIKPYFISSGRLSEYGFTGTCHIKINNLLRSFKYSNRKIYLQTKKFNFLSNNFWLVLKRYKLKKKEIITVHLESPLAEISRFLRFKAIEVKRIQGFHPFKTIEDINPETLNRAKNAMKRYNYIQN